jgi:PAS domain S-box-containing protein
MPKADILIVEDEAVVAADLAGKLERAGYRSVGIAADGVDAIETAKAMAPDLVLMDIRLSGDIDGIDTAERIRAFRNVPIVYLTAHSDTDTLRRAATTEPFGYILKPFEERDLTTQIEIALYKHQAERRLRESEERYRKLVETAVDSIITFDPEGLILSCNAATERMFGYRCDDLVGRNISMLIPAWFSEFGEGSPADASSRLMRLIGLWRELNGRRRQGDLFSVEIAVSESFSSGEIRYTGILRDISERKRTEVELRWRAGLLAQTHDAVIVWRLGGGITYWNRGAAELYGWTVAEVAGRPVHQLLQTVLPMDEDEFHRQLIEARRWQGEIRQKKKDGSVVVVESRMVTMTEDQGGILVLETNRDVTERHAMHEKVCRFAEDLELRVKERTQELVQSQALLRQLASELTIAEQRERRRIATDLHDYLAQLLVCTRLKVSQSRARPMEPEVEAWLGESEEILQQALTYTRTLVAQLTPMALHEFGLSAALKWLADQVRQQHRLTVKIELDDRLSVSLPEDQSVLLFQSVRELLINVAKHAHIDKATIGMAKEDGMLRITVRDEGRGADPAVFSNGGPSSKFGLFSIRERMHALGGTFELFSAPGKGTTAVLTLPLPAVSAELGVLGSESAGQAVSDQPSAIRFESHHAEHSQQQEKHRIRVLLVDDHAMVRQGLRSVLDAYADVEVVGEAANGEEAVEMVEQLRPSLVVMDINMPKMNGVEATSIITSRHRDTIVIGLSVQAGEEAQRAIMKAGAVVLLTKEAAVDELYRTIRESLEAQVTSDEQQRRKVAGAR